MSLIANPPTQELIDLVHALGGEWAGRTAMCRCPAHADSDPSLSLRQGDHGLLVHCFAGCAPDDVLRELARIRVVPGAESPPAGAPSRRSNVQRLWNEARDVRGTLAERYLRHRHFDDIPPDLRFHPRCPLHPRPHTVFLPAMLVAVRERTQLVALQRIFLDPVTARYSRKVMLGHPAAGAWQGGRPRDTLAIAEGFETAHAFTILHDIPCWAALGGRLDQIIFPERITRLLIAEDNDGPGRAAGTRVIERHSRTDLSIERCPPPRHLGDWADVLDARHMRP
ncbi:DUF7146 domain-containing protein [Sphingomonas sanxanigenens]|uniref:Virulence-associated protein E n=1 Tax=Sphingomonas sanxanigenens DSM 19645 = NX02 TaxID=1123269 RepID=A0A0F7JUK6_9SPHN|nr:toprim domain-containing protein [Sphingomonas sanxanigenens]AKH18969.1 virulence-associated protein E [Sphingomonas sanxanigenens DSM 19645 = NX02]